MILTAATTRWLTTLGAPRAGTAKVAAPVKAPAPFLRATA